MVESLLPAMVLFAVLFLGIIILATVSRPKTIDGESYLEFVPPRVGPPPNILDLVNSILVPWLTKFGYKCEIRGNRDFVILELRRVKESQNEPSTLAIRFLASDATYSWPPQVFLMKKNLPSIGIWICKVFESKAGVQCLYDARGENLIFYDSIGQKTYVYIGDR